MPDSPRGWWEINDKGRAYLAEHEQDAHSTGSDRAESSERVRATNIAHVSLPEEITDPVPLVEGAKERIYVNRYERNHEARHQCIDHYGAQCVVCGFDFETVYGPDGAGFIHVHHLRALADIGSAYEVDPIKDLCPVCPNCHAFIHLRNPPYEIEEVRDLRSKRTKAQSETR